MKVPKIPAVKWGAGSLFKLILKHWYLIILTIIIIPTIISSITLAIEEQNPAIPFVQLGLHLTNADAIIYEDVQILKENPTELIGMEKPEKGIWKNIVYYWHVFLVIWKELGLVWLISFPFVFLYRVFSFHGSKGFKSSRSADMTKAIIWGVVFIFIMNLIFALHKIITGTLSYILPENLGVYGETWVVILTTLPFHGISSLIIYLISLIT